MKYCENCGTQLQDTAKFCTNCGEKCFDGNILAGAVKPPKAPKKKKTKLLSIIGTITILIAIVMGVLVVH